MSNDRPRTWWTALYFVLTFIAGAAVGSWALWIYLIGFPSSASLPEPAASAPAAASAQPASPEVPASAPQPESEPTESAAAQPATPTPTPKGHWNHVDIAGRSHEECLALTKELNDAYKDCRFGVHQDVWVEE